MRQVWITDDVRPVISPEPKYRAARIAVVEIRQQRHGERPAGLKGEDAVRLPSAKQRLSPMAVKLGRRQIVGVTQGEPVAQIEIRAAALGTHVVTVLRKIRVTGARKEV